MLRLKILCCDMVPYVDPLLALESLGFICFRCTFSNAQNKKMSVSFTHSLKFGVVARVDYPSVGKSPNHDVEFYKLG